MAKVLLDESYINPSEVDEAQRKELVNDLVAEKILSMGKAKIFVPDIEKQTEEEWLNARRFALGGSDVSNIMGCGYGTRKDVFWSKTAQDDKLNEDTDKWFTFKYGHINEPLVLEAFERATGMTVYTNRCMWRSNAYPWLQADCDGFTFVNGDLYIVEAKTTNENSLREDWGGKNEERYPKRYEWQCRHYMAVTGAKGVFLVCLAGNSLDNLRIRLIEHDEDFEKELVDATEDFWENNVCSFVEPDDFEKDNRLLESYKRHYGVDDSTPRIEMDKEFRPLLKAYLDKKAKKSELEKQARELGKELDADLVPIAAYLEGKQGVCEFSEEEIYSVDWKTTTRKTIPAPMIAKLKAEHPDVADEYVQYKESNNLEIKKAKVLPPKKAS